jgi:hypothetical protein
MNPCVSRLLLILFTVPFWSAWGSAASCASRAAGSSAVSIQKFYPLSYRSRQEIYRRLTALRQIQSRSSGIASLHLLKPRLGGEWEWGDLIHRTDLVFIHQSLLW